MAGKEFGEHSSNERSNTPVTATGKAIQWNALRYMLSEVLLYDNLYLLILHLSPRSKGRCSRYLYVSL